MNVSGPRGADVSALCARIVDGAVPDVRDVETLLRARDDAAVVFAAARQVRARHCGDAVFLYGFVYFSTYCRNDCTFCFYRAGNTESPRYRKSPAEVVAICRDLASSGVVLLDLTMGEDPRLQSASGRAALVDLVAAVAAETGMPVMVSPGVLEEPTLRALREAGAAWYALYQETTHPSSTPVCGWGSRSRRAPGRAPRRAASGCWWRTVSSRASVTLRPTAPTPSSRCATQAGSRSG